MRTIAELRSNFNLASVHVRVTLPNGLKSNFSCHVPVEIVSELSCAVAQFAQSLENQPIWMREEVEE
jgi:hypothetical protein